MEILSDTFEEAEVIINSGPNLGFVDIRPLQDHVQKHRRKRALCYRLGKKSSHM